MRHPIEFDTATQPNSVSADRYRAEMDAAELKSVIWANVQTLMEREWGGDNLTQLGKRAGINNGGAQRLRDQASVGVDTIAKVAAAFDLDPWQLLAPNLGAAMRLSPAELEAVRKLRDPLQPKGDFAPGAVRLPSSPSVAHGPGIRKTAEQKRRPPPSKTRKER